MSWTIWGDSDLPLAVDLTEHQARVFLRENHALKSESTNLDLYAENDKGDLIERYDGEIIQ